MSVKEYLKKKNPEIAISEAIKEIQDKADSIIEKAINERFSVLEKQVKDIEPTSDMGMVDKITRNVLADIKGEKGDTIKGEDGLTPTDKELLALINPLIPKVKDGKTPTSKEILSIIKPLIPQVKDGATPTKAELLDLIIPLIPEPIKGEEGDDGKKIKSEEVAKKLNTLEEKVEMKVIKGLKAYLKKLETTLFYKGSRKGGGGGGMSNLVPETFEVGSSTTSITLQFEVASNGTAIWMYYNGQHLAQNVHYTVSGRVVTLDFTLTDNTYIDVKYHRK